MREKHVWISSEVHAKLKAYANGADREMGDCANEAIDMWVIRQLNPPVKPVIREQDWAK